MLVRDLENTIKLLLDRFPAVVLIGARQVGKSTLMQRVLPHAKYYDLEKESDFDYINQNPEFFLENSSDATLAIDEAQLCPKLFPALRVAIDARRNHKGRFLLSGSSSPLLQKNINESLAGRVAVLEIPSLTWSEACANTTSYFYDQLDMPDQLFQLKPNYSRDKLHELCFYGLYPEPFLERNDKIFYQQWQENYFRTYIERDVRSLFPQLQLESYKKLIRMLAISSGDLIKVSDYARSLDVSEPTVKRYLDIAEGTFVWSALRPYSKNVNKRLVKMPKGYLRDTVLTNYLLNINDIEMMLAHPKFGSIWECFVIEQIRKNLNSKLIRNQLYFYRTHNKAEIDLIIETESALIPIEIKSGSSIKSAQLKTLETFIEEHSCPYGLVINNGDEIRQLTKNIYQIPAIFL